MVRNGAMFAGRDRSENKEITATGTPKADRQRNEACSDQTMRTGNAMDELWLNEKCGG